mgnify:FL=1
MSDKLPSIEDFTIVGDLPSVDDLITEEKLPSLDEFIEKEDEDEVEDTAPCSIEENITEKEKQDLTEILRLINDVRKDIPEIPEIKSYDEELQKISENIEEVRSDIPEIPEVKYYDNEIETVHKLLDDLKEEINRNAADIPEIKYYDEQINELDEKIKNLPEIKHYDSDLTSLKEDIIAVKESIPVFPKWVNEVNEVPDFSWIGKTFSVIDDDFVKVNDGMDSIKNRINREVQEIAETFEVKEFENKIEVEKITKNLKETKDKIFKELREAALKIWDHHHEFKDDDRKLKKQILSHYNALKQKVDSEVKEFNRKNLETKDLSKGYFDTLAEEISNLPIPKYYDDNIKNIEKDVIKLNNHHDYNTTNITELYKIVEELKEKQEILKEEVNTRPIQPDPSEDNTDPLTPTNQNFATHEDLAEHYKLFVNRIQQQLYTIGGGGAGFIKDLDDVTFDSGIGTNKLLIYNGNKWVGIASTALIGDISEASGDFNVAGNITGTAATFTGNVTVGGTITYDDVTFLDSVGVATARSGLDVGGGSITPIISIQAATDTTTTTSVSTIDSFSKSTFRSAQYQIQITQGSNYHVTTLNVLHDGSTVFLNEFGTIRTGASLASFDADISSDNVRVRATPTTDSSTVFKLTKTLTRV